MCTCMRVCKWVCQGAGWQRAESPKPSIQDLRRRQPATIGRFIANHFFHRATLGQPQEEAPPTTSIDRGENLRHKFPRSHSWEVAKAVWLQSVSSQKLLGITAQEGLAGPIRRVQSPVCAKKLTGKQECVLPAIPTANTPRAPATCLAVSWT